MNLPLISILQLNPKDMSVVLQALLSLANDQTNQSVEAKMVRIRAHKLLDRIEAKMPHDDTQE